LDHFGYSAPAKVLEEKFGYTVEHTLAEIKEFLATR
jgi:transketolase